MCRCFPSQLAARGRRAALPPCCWRCRAACRRPRRVRRPTASPISPTSCCPRWSTSRRPRRSSRSRGPATRQTAAPVPQFPPGSPFEEFFKDFFDRNSRRGGRPRGAAAQGDLARLRLHHRPSRLYRHQQPRHRRCRRDHGHPARRHRAEGRGRRPRHQDRPRGAEGQDRQAADRRRAGATATQARVGDWVLAIGNPFGLGGSVTAGILSARQRDINSGPYDDFLQTDASINRGNSGGPMFNMDGAGHRHRHRDLLAVAAARSASASRSRPTCAKAIVELIASPTTRCGAAGSACASRRSPTRSPRASASTSRRARWSPASTITARPRPAASSRAT